MSWREKIVEKAKLALEKRSKYGEDVPLSDYITNEDSTVQSLEDADLTERVTSVGIDIKGRGRSASFLQVDHSVLMAQLLSKTPGLEVLNVEEALKKHDWLKKYLWNVVEVDQDKFTAAAELYGRGGYFIRAAPNTKIQQPVQTCLFIGTHGLLQAPHNIVIAEPGSEVHIITGCTTGRRARKALHIGITEMYVKQRAKIVFTMIHSWPDDAVVRPRTAVIVEDEGVFVSNYITLHPFKSLQAFPAVYLVGKNSIAKFNNIVYAARNTSIDLGSRAILGGEGARAEAVFKTVASGSATVVNRGEVVGAAPNTKGHLECRGLMLCPTATIRAIPELIAKHSETDLSHEAAIGRLQEEQLNYLMARGVSPDMAISLLVRGFLDPELPELPPALQLEIKKSLAILEGRRY